MSTLDATFLALADPTRRAILDRLSRGEATVSELAKPFKISLQAVSKHLKILERARLLKRTVDGRVHRLALEAKPMEEAEEWIAKYKVYWERQFDSLERYLNEKTSRERESS